MPVLLKRDSEKRKKLEEEYHSRFKDYVWILEHEEELRQLYPDKYVAVRDKEIKFTADNIESLIDEIRASEERLEDFVIEFIETKPFNLLL